LTTIVLTPFSTNSKAAVNVGFLAENKTEIKYLGKSLKKFTSRISVQIKHDPNLSYIEAYLATALKPIKYQIFTSEK
jgi:hypothetical protein